MAAIAGSTMPVPTTIPAAVLNKGMVLQKHIFRLSFADEDHD